MDWNVEQQLTAVIDKNQFRCNILIMSLLIQKHTLKAILITLVAWCSMAVYAEPSAPALVRVRFRDKATKYGQIESFRQGKYRFRWVDGKSQSVSPADISAITYRPDVPDGFIAALKRRSVGKVRPMTQAEALQMAIKQLKAERQEERKKRLALAQDNVAQLGLGNIVGTITEDIQDNLLDILAEDRELQSIIMDKEIQETLEGGDYMSLMNNEKIMNLVRNKKKMDKMKGALFGDEDEEKKKKVKKVEEEEGATEEG